MLTGKELGDALAEAMRLKGVTQATVAREFGVTQPSVSEWQKNGRLGKKHIPHLVQWFSDVVGPEHWGLPANWGPTSAAHPSQPHWRRVGTLAAKEITRRKIEVDLVRFLDFVDALAEMIPEQADDDAAASAVVRHLRLVA